VLIVFVAMVASLCLVCADAGTARVRRDAVELDDRLALVPITERVVETRAAAEETKVEEEDDVLATEPPPRDPVLAGDCSLFLSLVSLETGEAVASPVKLFRLGAPGNERWTAGDQLQVEWNVPKEGVWFRGLPEGRYRLRAAAQRHPSDDPLCFSVRGAVTRLQFALPMPREFRGRLIVVDECGRTINDAQTMRAFFSTHMRTLAIPWVRPRKLRHPDRYVVTVRRFCGSGVGCSGQERWQRATVTDGGFSLGTFRESPRYAERSVPTYVRIEGRTDVRVRQEHEPGRDQTWMAISVVPSTIEDTILFPDGSLATRARIWIRGDAVLVPDPPPAGFWQTLKLTVRVRLEGFEEMEFEVNPQSPPVPRFLRPTPTTQDE